MSISEDDLDAAAQHIIERLRDTIPDDFRYGDPVDIGGSEHGTHAGYVRGCRCWDCRDARRVYNRQWMAEQRRKERLEARRGL